jgi:hypothetical protein
MVDTKIDCLVGKSEDEVVESLKKDNKVYRVVRRDKEEFMKSMDYDQNRLNLEIESGTVVSISIG